MSRWCSRCLIDAPYRNGLNHTGCPLIVTALLGRTPAEWLPGPRDLDGRYSIAEQYRCVNFREPGGRRVPAAAPGQGELFGWPPPQRGPRSTLPVITLRTTGDVL